MKIERPYLVSEIKLKSSVINDSMRIPFLELIIVIVIKEEIKC